MVGSVLQDAEPHLIADLNYPQRYARSPTLLPSVHLVFMQLVNVAMPASCFGDNVLGKSNDYPSFPRKEDCPSNSRSLVWDLIFNYPLPSCPIRFTRMLDQTVYIVSVSMNPNIAKELVVTLINASRTSDVREPNSPSSGTTLSTTLCPYSECQW